MEIARDGGFFKNLRIGRLSFFDEEELQPKPQPSMDRQGPPRKIRTGIGLLDRGDGGSGRDVNWFRSSYFEGDHWWRAFIRGTGFWLRGVERFLIDIKHNRIVL